MPPRDDVVETAIQIRATPATVFRFFEDPERFARWWSAPGGGRATIEPHVGGAVRIEYVNGAVMSGEVVEMKPCSRFAFTWGYAQGNDAVPAGSSRVEILLEPNSEGTRLVLRHSGLPTAEQRTGHAMGWRHYLSCMARECADDEFGDKYEATVAAWHRAWNTTDAGGRKAAIESCFDPRGEFCDAFSAVSGSDTLPDHIGNAQRHMPGIELQAVGKPQLMQGFVRAPWRMVKSADGTQLGTGVNFLELAPSGKIRRVVGFGDGPG